MNTVTEKVFVSALKHLGGNPMNWRFPWCAAFLTMLLNENGIKNETTLMARSLLGIGESVSEPQLGDVVILWREEKESAWGHCGLYVYEDADNYFLLGGNQQKRVMIKAYPKTQLLGVRRFNDAENNQTQDVGNETCAGASA